MPPAGFHYHVDSYAQVLQGQQDDVVVALTAVAPDGRELGGRSEILSDADLTLLARSEAAKRADESWPAYEARVTALVTWSQDHVLQLAATRCQAAVDLRPRLERVVPVVGITEPVPPPPVAEVALDRAIDGDASDRPTA